MKETIEYLKKKLKITEPKTDAKLAKFLGVTKNTIVRQKRGDKTKLYKVLPMLKYLISGLSEAKLKEFWEIFLKPKKVE